MPYDLELERPSRVRDPRRAPARQPLDGLIAILERVAASRDADRVAEKQQPAAAPANA